MHLNLFNCVRREGMALIMEEFPKYKFIPRIVLSKWPQIIEFIVHYMLENADRILLTRNSNTGRTFY